VNKDKHLIVFYRKTIHADSYSNKVSESARTMATDYFDVVDIKNYTKEAPLTKLIDENPICNDSCQDDVTIQSYPIYCDTDKIQKYKIALNNDDPLGHNDLPYMSMIQVHITPEVLARLVEFNILDENENTVDLFRDDLYDVFNSFVKSFPEYRIRYRVYNTLSAGDFTIIIKSDKADTSFRISTMLRRRIANNNGKEATNIVLYKTYTVLTFDSSIIATDLDEIETNNGLFAIRCCFSNKYWAEKNKIDLHFKDFGEEISNNIFRLNGRYDFSLELTDDEFKQIYPLIAERKGIKLAPYENKTYETDKINEKKFCKVSFLIFLLKNGYISYINERYLFKYDDANDSKVTSSESKIKIFPKCTDDEFLDQYNDSKYKVLLQNFNIVNKNIQKITFYRKNVMYYMSLLKKLIGLCQTINGLSDTRIYAAMLMNQLDVVLKGTYEYLQAIVRTGNFEFLNDLESCLRESVIALDSYAKYIRDNNLQSMQTPNYTLESNISMEKCLISYTHFLKEFIDWYNEEKTKKGIGEITQDFCPVMLPNLSNSNVSIELMFPTITDRLEEKNVKRLMVVKCPTLRDLTNMPEMISLLFHEVAHQFRYEKRSKRNEALLHYCVSAAFEPLLHRIQTELNIKLPQTYEVNTFIKSFFGTLLKEIYVKKMYKKSDIIFKYPLFVFRNKIVDDLSMLWEKHNLEENLQRYKNNIFESIKFDIDSKIDGENINTISTFYDSMKKGFKNKKDAQNKLTNFKNALCKLCRFENGYDSITALLNYLDEKDNDCIIELLLCKISLREIYEEFYSELCKKIEQNESDTPDMESCPEYRFISRYLGIDYKTDANFNEFYNLLISKSDFSFRDVKNIVFSSINEYREQTSDLFMCNLLSLTPFGYLNIMAHVLPVNTKLTDLYRKRLSYVIYFSYKINNRDDLYNILYEDISKNIKMLLDYHKDEFDKHKICFNYSEFNSASQQNKIPDEQLSKLKDFCLYVKKQLIATGDNIFSDSIAELNHYYVMLRIVISLFVDYENCISTLMYTPEMNEDLKRGAKILKGLHNNLKNHYLWKYCDISQKVLNTPYIKYSSEKSKISEINAITLRFIEDMYYTNKVQSAQNIIKEGNN